MKTSEARSARAETVKRLLEEIQFYDMMQTARKELVDGITQSDPHEHKKRESAYHVLLAFEQVERHITSILADGSVAKMELNRGKRNGQ